MIHDLFLNLQDEEEEHNLHPQCWSQGSVGDAPKEKADWRERPLTKESCFLLLVLFLTFPSFFFSFLMLNLDFS